MPAKKSSARRKPAKQLKAVAAGHGRKIRKSLRKPAVRSSLDPHEISSASPLHKLPVYEMRESRAVEVGESDAELFDAARSQWLTADWDALADWHLSEFANHPKRARLALLLAAALHEVGDYDGSKEALRQAVEWGAQRRDLINVVIGQAHAALGRARLAAKDFRSAERHFLACIMSTVPNRSAVNYAKHRVFQEAFALGVLPDALNFFEQELAATKWQPPTHPANVSAFPKALHPSPQASHSAVPRQGSQLGPRSTEASPSVTQRLLTHDEQSPPGHYNAEDYWHKRHSQYRFDLRGVGNKTLSAEHNAIDYDNAGTLILSLCHDYSVDLSSAEVLDVGCGSGFYAALLSTHGARNYLGIDITDVLFDELRGKYPSFAFLKCDITTSCPTSQYDLILMLDVTQHITNDELFYSAMRNVAGSLAPNGVLFVTSWLDGAIRQSSYERSRTLAAYIKALPHFVLSSPRPFRDKFIFVVTRATRGL
jgi:2-polyprenyl-3-methyl-5-hydroxy-6-metoxy-1,4-benzoquinol methylase